MLVYNKPLLKAKFKR